jgi:hypothetical protein
METPPPSDALLDAVGRMQPVRTRRPARMLAMVALLALAWAAAWLPLGLRRDFRELPPVWLFGAALLWAIGFALPLTVALIPARGQVLPRAATARILAAAVPLVLVGASMFAAQAPASRIALDGHQWINASLRCCVVGLVIGLVPCALAMFALRRALPVGSRAIGAALGAAGGALGGLILHLHCSWAQPSHVAAAHGGAVAIGALLGALVGPLLLAL